jgi:hypothetical protein
MSDDKIEDLETTAEAAARKLTGAQDERSDEAGLPEATPGDAAEKMKNLADRD